LNKSIASNDNCNATSLETVGINQLFILLASVQTPGMASEHYLSTTCHLSLSTCHLFQIIIPFHQQYGSDEYKCSADKISPGDVGAGVEPGQRKQQENRERKRILITLKTLLVRPITSFEM